MGQGKRQGTRADGMLALAKGLFKSIHKMARIMGS
jgi:hypothetical protein